MKQAQHNRIVSFIWGIADDVLRDVIGRGKYRDVILPMMVIRRLDIVLESTKEAVLQMKANLDKAGVMNQEEALCHEAKQAFYNDSPFTLQSLRSRSRQQQLKQDFITYIDGFSKDVQDILDKFKFRNQIPTLVEHDILGALIEKFGDNTVNLSPKPAKDAKGNILQEGLDNHSMGTVFEELIRRFNEENNEEAGEHFTPRDVVSLMTDLIFVPIADKIQDGTYLLYDGACGTGGMLTVAEARLKKCAKEQNKKVSIHLYGQESQPETYAIMKADLLIKGDGEEARNFVNGSTLSKDGFIGKEFDFMLSNPPYGKSWQEDCKRMGGKKDISDLRFKFPFADDAEYSMLPRESDGQMLFLVNKLMKMKKNTVLGSRIAHVHNGSSLFTGDAGGGESNIRRWILENDWLEAIIAIPENIFYNTGIPTYIWLLTNRKEKQKQGLVQLIDASAWYETLRKNLGKKNCQFNEEHIKKIVDLVVSFEETEQSKIFKNKEFGYTKVTVERPLRIKVFLNKKKAQSLRYFSGEEDLKQRVYMEFGEDIYTKKEAIQKEIKDLLQENESEEESEKTVSDKALNKVLDFKKWGNDRVLFQKANQLIEAVGEKEYLDANLFIKDVQSFMKMSNVKMSKSEIKNFLKVFGVTDEKALKVIKQIHKNKEPNPLQGLFPVTIDGKSCVVEYEADADKRDTEQVPLLYEGGIEAFITKEVLPYVTDAWIDVNKHKIGYEISFNRHFYKPVKLRSAHEIEQDLINCEKETAGLLEDILAGGSL